MCATPWIDRNTFWRQLADEASSEGTRNDERKLRKTRTQGNVRSSGKTRQLKLSLLPYYTEAQGSLRSCLGPIVRHQMPDRKFQDQDPKMNDVVPEGPEARTLEVRSTYP
jgi:hypothetical protein